MNALLNRALGVVQSLPEAEQDEIARAMLAMAGDEEPVEEVDPEHLPFILEGLKQVAEGRFASPAEVSAAFARFDK
jgi:hypothetical protein